MIKGTIQKIKRHATFLNFGFSSTLVSLVGMFSGIIVIRWLQPEEIGLWQSVLIIQTWALIFQFGVTSGLSRELPYHLGKNEKEYARSLAASAQTIVQIGLVLLVATACIVPFFFDQLELKVAFFVVFYSSGLTLYQTYLGTTFRANQEFRIYSRILKIDSAVFLFSLPLVYFWGYYGLVLRFALTTTTATCLRHFNRPIVVRSAFDKKHLATLFKVGAPMFGFGYIIQAIDTFPRLLLLTQDNGVLLVGLFAPASAIFSLMRMLPRSLGAYVFPQMSFRLGATKDARSLWPIAWKSSVYFLLAALPLVFIGLYVFPWIIRQWFANYSEAISAIGWALIAGAFMGTRVGINSLYSLKAYRWLVVYTTLNLVSGWLIPSFLFSYYDPLVAVTMGFAVSRVLMFFIGLFCIERATRGWTE